MILWTEEDCILISKRMIEQGEPFIKFIGKALKFANQARRNKLAQAFAKDFSYYYYLNKP